MSSLFTKKKMVLFIVLSFTLIVLPVLFCYNYWQKYALRKRIDESDSLVVCDCCGKWRSEKETVPYIHKDTKYTVCRNGQATSTTQLKYALEKNKYVKKFSLF